MEKNTLKVAALKIDETAEEADEKDCLKWGLPLVEIYKLSLKFYKGKETNLRIFLHLPQSS